jgi:hypothetical protein
MGECMLHVLDAPRIKSQEAATAFIAKWADHDSGTAHPRISAFLQDILRKYPDLSGEDTDGEDDKNIWYEGFANNKPHAPVVTLVFKLAALNEQVLKFVRETAGRHGLHLFDAGGDVLYLSNGKEVSAAAFAASAAKQDPLSALKGATRSAAGLRYNGVYLESSEGACSYYRFTPEGRAYRMSVKGSADPKAAFMLMTEADPFTAHGRYVVEDNEVLARVRAAYGAFSILAKIDGDTLSVTSIPSGGGNRHSAVYKFVEVR